MSYFYERIYSIFNDGPNKNGSEDSTKTLENEKFYFLWNILNQSEKYNDKFSKLERALNRNNYYETIFENDDATYVFDYWNKINFFCSRYGCDKESDSYVAEWKYSHKKLIKLLETFVCKDKKFETIRSWENITKR